MEKIISGIQQIGIGIPNVAEAWKWYRQNFGMNIKIFEDAAEAPLMTRYTGGNVHKRNAALAMNMQGGGGFEIWQYTSRTAQPSGQDLTLRDLGILAAKIKSRDVKATYASYRKKGLDLPGGLKESPEGGAHFFVRDPFGNLFEIVAGDSWFKNTKSLTGGAYGCLIGCSDIEKSMVVYRDILGYNSVVYDKTGQFEDLAPLPGGEGTFRRVLLKQSQPRKGAFSKLLGPSVMELLQPEKPGNRIFENRYWGDLGFIHLCFDVQNMSALKKECQAAGHPFTVDSGDSFDMGKAAGRFSYIEDPDGALIEFVETHKLPVVEKFGLFLNLKNRNPEKPLPYWMLNSLRFNKVKE